MVISDVNGYFEEGTKRHCEGLYNKICKFGRIHIFSFEQKAAILGMKKTKGSRNINRGIFLVKAVAVGICGAKHSRAEQAQLCGIPENT